MSGSILFDYTTFVGAANAVNCRDLVFPLSTRSPYSQLLAGAETPADSPMWLEWAALAELAEAIMFHGELLIMTVSDKDRVLERGRYSSREEPRVALMAKLRQAGVVRDIEPTPEEASRVQEWLRSGAADAGFVDRLLESMFRLLKHPAYRAMPDLFSHSQTVYKFDGETVWRSFAADLPARQFSRRYQLLKARSGYAPELSYTHFFYAEEIFAFLIRGLIYNELAKARRVAYRPHPLRSAVAMSDGLWAEDRTADFGEVPVDFIANLRSVIATQQNEELGKRLFEVDVPPVLAAVLRESRLPEDIPGVLLQMRESSAAKAARKWVDEVEQGGGLRLIEARNELQSFGAAMRRELGLERETISTKLWIFSYSVKVPQWAQTTFYVGGRRHLQFLKSLLTSSLDVRSLEGELKRIFSA